MARFTVVVGRDFPNAFEELRDALSGEDVRVILDRRARPARADLGVPTADVPASCAIARGGRRSSDRRAAPGR